MSELKKLIDNLVTARDHKKTQLDLARKASQGVLLGHMQTAFDEIPELQTLLVRGYTMGFNDGEPCYHSQMEPVINGFDTDTGEEEDENVVPLSSKDTDLIIGLCRLLTDTFELAFETNFAITFARNGNKVKMDQDSYDCGY